MTRKAETRAMDAVLERAAGLGRELPRFSPVSARQANERRYRADDLFSAAAARTSVLKAAALIFSPS